MRILLEHVVGYIVQKGASIFRGPKLNGCRSKYTLYERPEAEVTDFQRSTKQAFVDLVAKFRWEILERKGTVIVHADCIVLVIDLQVVFERAFAEDEIIHL